MIDLSQLGADALAVGLLGVRPVLNSGTAQGLDHQAGGIVGARPDPSGRAAGDARVFGRESLGRGAGAVEDHRRGSVQIIAKEAGALLLFWLVRELA